MVYSSKIDAFALVADIDIKIRIGNWPRVRLSQHFTLYQTLQKGVFNNTFGLSRPPPSRDLATKTSRQHLITSTKPQFRDNRTAFNGRKQLKSLLKILLIFYIIKIFNYN